MLLLSTARSHTLSEKRYITTFSFSYSVFDKLRPQNVRQDDITTFVEKQWTRNALKILVLYNFQKDFLFLYTCMEQKKLLQK